MRKFTFFLLSLFTLQLILALIKLTAFNYHDLFGYLDYQLYWQNLNDFSLGKLIYRDFYWEYGWLYLALGQIPFILLGKTFQAMMLIRLILVPVISIGLSYLLAKNFFSLKNKSWLLLFLFMLFLFGINDDFTSLRHLLPEAGTVLFIVAHERQNRRLLWLGSLLLGLALTSSIEYAIAGLISVMLYLLLKRLSLFQKPHLPVLVIPLPLFLILLSKGALGNYYRFMSEYAQSFYNNSPCREFFPRPLEFTGVNLGFLLRLNLYFLPILIVILTVWYIIKARQQIALILPLLAYSLAIYSRSFSTPCFGYLSYGFTLPFLILVYTLSQNNKTRLFKIFLWVVILWFMIPGSLNLFQQLIPQFKIAFNPPKTQTSYLPGAGIYLDTTLVSQYQEVTQYLQTHTATGDLIYVYANGPYNQLAGRSSPVNIVSTWYYDLAPFLNPKTLDRLTASPPKYVVLNVYNSGSLVSSLNLVHYNVYISGKDIVFEGLTTPVEDFISQNYDLAAKYPLAWILQKTSRPKIIAPYYLLSPNTHQWEISVQGITPISPPSNNGPITFLVQNELTIAYANPDLDQADVVKLPFKVNLGILKPISKYVINAWAVDANNNYYNLGGKIVSTDWQTIWIYPKTVPKQATLTTIILKSSPNWGFLWWGHPLSLEIKPPEILNRNPNLKIDDQLL
jgi:hypothetical protein